jgi:hypothetical protein
MAWESSRIMGVRQSVKASPGRARQGRNGMHDPSRRRSKVRSVGAACSLAVLTGASLWVACSGEKNVTGVTTSPSDEVLQDLGLRELGFVSSIVEALPLWAGGELGPPRGSADSLTADPYYDGSLSAWRWSTTIASEEPGHQGAVTSDYLVRFMAGGVPLGAEAGAEGADAMYLWISQGAPALSTSSDGAAARYEYWTESTVTVSEEGLAVTGEGWGRISNRGAARAPRAAGLPPLDSWFTIDVTIAKAVCPEGSVTIHVSPFTLPGSYDGTGTVSWEFTRMDMPLEPPLTGTISIRCPLVPGEEADAPENLAQPALLVLAQLAGLAPRWRDGTLAGVLDLATGPSCTSASAVEPAYDEETLRWRFSDHCDTGEPDETGFRGERDYSYTVQYLAEGSPLSEEAVATGADSMAARLELTAAGQEEDPGSGIPVDLTLTLDLLLTATLPGGPFPVEITGNIQGFIGANEIPSPFGPFPVTASFNARSIGCPSGGAVVDEGRYRVELTFDLSDTAAWELLEDGEPLKPPVQGTVLLDCPAGGPP